MTRLPPTEKLPLAVRKDLRDGFDAKKAEFEKQLSDLMGVPWKLEINPNAIYPYATEGWAKDSLGRCLASYIEGAVYQLKRFEDEHGAAGTTEVNDICFEHVLGMDVDEAKRFTYCGCIISDGKLIISFAPDRLGTNTDQALQKEYLLAALNTAPPASGNDSKLSYAARAGIRLEWDSKFEPVRAKAAEILQVPGIKLIPNFDDAFATLSKEKKRKGNDLGDDWETRLGWVVFQYFEGFVDQLKSQKFDDDEMLQEGFNEAVDKNEIALRIVETLKYDSYCEVVVEDGVLYIQTTPSKWGSNTWYAGQKLVDQL